MWWTNKVRALLALVCVGARIATNTKRSELYIGAISEKLRGGFVINQKYANLPAERTAWTAAAAGLGVCFYSLWRLEPDAATLRITLNAKQPPAHVKGRPSWLFIYSHFGAMNVF